MSNKAAPSPVPSVADEREIWARFLDPLFNLSRRTIFVIVVVMVGLIAFADWYIERNSQYRRSLYVPDRLRGDDIPAQ